MHPFIKVEVTENEEEGFSSILFIARDDTDESRQVLDGLLASIMDPTRKKRGGMVPGNALRIDIKYPDDETNNTEK